MMSFIRTCGLLGSLLAAGVVAGPVAVRSSNIEVLPTIQERTPSIALGSYSLSTTHEKDVLFNLAYGTTSANVGDTLHLEVECVDCRTWGTAVVTTSGVSKDEDIIGDIISFFENPVDTIVSAFDMDIKIEFEDCGGHFEFDIVAADTVSYSFPIYESSTPVGIACSEEVSVGLVLAIDLVFSLTAEIDLEAGFEFSFPEGAYITVDPLGGDIVDHGFSGGEVDHLPIICTSGSATFKAALRVRVQAGTTVEVFGTGFDFELGVYADLIEYVATIGTTDTCELAITESVDVNIGAFAHAVVELDYKTFGVSPAVVTTVLDLPLPSLCIRRPVDASLPAFPTATATLVGTPIAISDSYPTATTAASTTTSGAIFFQGSSSYVASGSAVASVSYAASSSASASGSYTVSSSYAASGSASASSGPSPATHTNSTITSAASLTTSTVYATDLITITSCSVTVLHCPASLTSEIIVTSTRMLYTTVCPVGQVQPTFTPTASSTSKSRPVNTASIIVSPTPLTPCATPVVSTIYTPTFVNPTYTIPTATSFTVPYPNWNAASTSSSTTGASPTTSPIVVGGASTITLAPVYSSSSAPIKSISAANSTVLATGSVKAQPTGPATFTGAAARSVGSLALGAIIALGVTCFVLM